MKQQVTVWMEGGVIHDVDLPPGVSLELRDYDTEGGLDEDDPRLCEDEHGEEYLKLEFEGDSEKAKSFRDALSTLIDGARLRMEQYLAIKNGDSPSEVCDELYECSIGEASIIAERYSEAISIVEAIL